MTLPKADLPYATGNAATGTSFVTETNKNTGSLIVNGATIPLDTSKTHVALGAAYAADVWALRPLDGTFAGTAG